ncbi:hypothetical protein PR048_001835 [Dryococelus australis]|uniref:Integrase catalytic domain-containing protein n=1 Tax=Dryococelus australis TaxID=614101 RepID=A0ABQ9IIK8_9NEOP|nr:hypothetical protein PR048_001835 [Dryococelus australis]
MGETNTQNTRIPESQSAVRRNHRWRPSTNCASRGLSPLQLIEHKLWWHGSTWLCEHPDRWPGSVTNLKSQELPEIKEQTLSGFTVEGDGSSPVVEVISRFFSLWKLQQIIAFVLRFVKNSRSTSLQKQLGPLSVKELEAVLTVCIKAVQVEAFKNEMYSLRCNGEFLRCKETQGKPQFIGVSDNLDSAPGSAALAAFDRFVSRHGLCAHVYSDCGTNFIGNSKSRVGLQSLVYLREASSDTVNGIVKRTVTWHFNPPSAPHFGCI